MGYPNRAELEDGLAAQQRLALARLAVRHDDRFFVLGDQYGNDPDAAAGLNPVADNPAHAMGVAIASLELLGAIMRAPSQPLFGRGRLARPRVGEATMSLPSTTSVSTTPTMTKLEP